MGWLNSVTPSADVCISFYFAQHCSVVLVRRFSLDFLPSSIMLFIPTSRAIFGPACLFLTCVEFRMLDTERRRSRIWWSFSGLDNCLWMSSSMYQWHHMRCCWLGADQRRKILLDSNVNRHQKYYANWRHYSLWTTPSLPELVLLLLYKLPSYAVLDWLHYA